MPLSQLAAISHIPHTKHISNIPHIYIEYITYIAFVSRNSGAPVKCWLWLIPTIYWDDYSPIPSRCLASLKYTKTHFDGFEYKLTQYSPWVVATVNSSSDPSILVSRMVFATPHFIYIEGGILQGWKSVRQAWSWRIKLLPQIALLIVRCNDQQQCAFSGLQLPEDRNCQHRQRPYYTANQCMTTHA